MSKYRHPISNQARFGIFAGVSAVLLALAVILSSPSIQSKIVNAVGYSGTGGWSATGTMGGQQYDATWIPNDTGYDVAGTAGGQNFNYAVTGSYPAVGGGAPIGAINFFEGTTCPTGWEEVVEARGRYIVGMNSGGTLKAVVGTALSNQENRIVGQHNHSASGLGFSGTAVPNHQHGVYRHAAGQSGGVQTQGAGSGDNITSVSDNWLTAAGGAHTPSGSVTGSTANNGTISGTNAPYIQLLVCRNVSDTGGGSGGGGAEGPAGPQGPPGPAGPTGSQGPAGLLTDVKSMQIQCANSGCQSSANSLCAQYFGSGYKALALSCEENKGNAHQVVNFNTSIITYCKDQGYVDGNLSCYK